jgi:hypothetical protein
MRTLALSLFATVAMASTPALATPFSGTGLPQADAVFAGGSTTATFTTSNQTFASYSESGITISGGRIDNTYASDYNSFGSYYDNNEGNIGTISFMFSNPTAAFAFNWGAADNDWIIELFSGATSLGNFVLAPTYSSNAKEYFGFTGSGITSAVLTNTTGYDWVFVDNLTVATGNVSAAVPEPATWAMLFLGFFALGAVMRSAKRRERIAVTYA